MKHFQSSGPNRAIEFGLDAANQRLWRNGVQLAVPPKPFEVLRYLVENPGRLITHDELLDALWPETYVQPQVLRTYILDLRKTLGDDAGNPQFIQTLPKRGYCFVAAVLDEPKVDSKTKASAGQKSTPPKSEPRQPAPGPRHIVGREKELARLNQLLDLVESRQRQIVFIVGEAGIGKTALVDGFSEYVSRSVSAATARGECVKGFGKKEEYYPVTEALAQLCSSPKGEHACRILSRMAPAWLAALGLDVPDASAADVRSNLQRMPGDLCAALEECSLAEPMILIFEDLQWADESTLQLISALARRRAPSRLMVLATMQPKASSAEGEFRSDHSLKALRQDLLMRRLSSEIALNPLSRSAVSTLLSRQLQQESLPNGLSHLVHLHSEGNPLFVIAILDHLIAQRFLVQDGLRPAKEDSSCTDPFKAKAGVWQQRTPFSELETALPDGLAQMIELEIERLTPEEQNLLEAGSLTSIAFPAWSVAAALELDPAEVEEACDALARRLFFLDRAGQDELPDRSQSAFYVFAHGLYREALYQRQPASRRAKRHIRIAHKLSSLFAGRESDVAREISIHFEAAASWMQAISALRLAASHANQRLACAEAVQLLEHAAKLSANLKESDRQGISDELQHELRTANETLKVSSDCIPALSTKA